jgi:micrococcal nuclease
MRVLLLCLWFTFLGVASAGERCLAIDGDTLVCNHQKVRLTNVYAAELNQAGGPAAKRRLQSLIASGEVTLRPLGHDRYGRTLAEVYIDGRRVEQSDIGPRAGRGSDRRADRHYFVFPAKHRKLRKPPAAPPPGALGQWRLAPLRTSLHFPSR